LVNTGADILTLTAATYTAPTIVVRARSTWADGGLGGGNVSVADGATSSSIGRHERL
jgi:hypothetical protein